MQTPPDRFVTPERIEPLGLDLASLTGGGTAPAQYHGTTQDGRSLFARYRGGHLSLHLARVAGGDARGDGDTRISARVGPPLDGALSRNQLCRICGLTVQGAIPDDLRDDEGDLSGATTYWSSAAEATKDGALAFLSDLRATFPEVVVRQHHWDLPAHREVTEDISGDQKPSRATLSLRLADGVPVLRLMFVLFEWDHRGFGSAPMLNELAARVGRPIAVAGFCGSGLAYQRLSLSCAFATGDEAARGYVVRLQRLLDACFPWRAYTYTDLATGVSVAAEPFCSFDDPRIAAWVGGQADRYRFISRLPDSGPDIGCRP